MCSPRGSNGDPTRRAAPTEGPRASSIDRDLLTEGSIGDSIEAENARRGVGRAFEAVGGRRRAIARVFD